MKNLTRCGIVAAILFVAGTLHAQDENILAGEYDKAFYAKRFDVALPIIDSLVRIDPKNLHYRREKVKMLALLNKNETCVKELFEMKKLEEGEDFPHLTEIFAFPGLSEKIKEMVRIQAEQNQEMEILNRFFPEKLDDSSNMAKASIEQKTIDPATQQQTIGTPAGKDNVIDPNLPK